jgi:hypothetical protein
MRREEAMTRLESSAWPLAGGSASVFVLAIVLNRLPWQAVFALIILAVVAWAWRGPVIVGAAIGGIAWLCVTGFDVHRLGEIRITGSSDAVRAAVLVLAGLLAASAHAVAGARRGYRRADPVWVDFHETDLAPNHTSADVMARLNDRIPRQDGVVRFERATPRTPDRGTE